MIAKRFQVFGQVQGVGFRYTTARVARNLDITGWCRNLSDGTVEVCAYGDPVNIQQLHAWLKGGPPSANVSRVESYVVEMERPDSFRIVR